MPRRTLRILTWHVHGNYLYYLTQVPHEWYVLSKPNRPPGYAGRTGELPWGENVHDMPVDEVAYQEFDCILYQSQSHYLEDRSSILGERHQHVPRIFLEHDPPTRHPTDTRHPFQDAHALLVHVTQYNQLMWDNGVTPTRVIEHGVLVPPEVTWSGELERGIVVVNNMQRRGRRLGADLFRALRERVPLDLIGMEAEAEGGFGEVRNVDVPAYIARYRFFFHPCRYTSLGLALVEAMSIGMPIVGLSTTELATVIRPGHNGFISNDPAELEEAMRELLRDPARAMLWGEAARETARLRFGIARFVRDWNETLRSVCENGGATRETLAA